MAHREFQPGDQVIFTVDKYSPRPGPRAREIDPDAHGEGYRYRVDKFWVVAGFGDEGKLILRTRRGKVRQVDASCPSLRRPSWWERFRFHDRFPRLDGTG